MHYGWKAKGKGKGKQGVFQAGATIAAHGVTRPYSVRNAWLAGRVMGPSVSRMPQKAKAKERTMASASSSSHPPAKGSWTRVSTRAGASRMTRALSVKERDARQRCHERCVGRARLEPMERLHGGRRRGCFRVFSTSPIALLERNRPLFLAQVNPSEWTRVTSSSRRWSPPNSTPRSRRPRCRSKTGSRSWGVCSRTTRSMLRSQRT